MVRRRLESVGRPLPTLELDIHDETGNPVPQGEPGEIWVRSGQVSGAYVGTLTRLEDGWFPANDAGWLDADGFLHVQARLDQVNLRGGDKIAFGDGDSPAANCESSFLMGLRHFHVVFDR